MYAVGILNILFGLCCNVTGYESNFCLHIQKNGVNDPNIRSVPFESNFCLHIQKNGVIDPNNRSDPIAKWYTAKKVLYTTLHCI